MDIRKLAKDEVTVRFTRSVTYTFTTTVEAIRRELPSAAEFPTDGAENAADVVYAWLVADVSIERDTWMLDQAEREGTCLDEMIEVDEISLA